MKKLLSNFLAVLGVVFFIWCFASVINTGLNNSPLANDNTYAWWNLFNIFESL